MVSVTPGNEISGGIETVAAGVTSVTPADRVCVQPLVPCGECQYCRTGHQLCAHAHFLAADAIRQGGVGPESSVYVLGAGTIGLLALQAARANGAGQVLITARHAHQAAAVFKC